MAECLAFISGALNPADARAETLPLFPGSLSCYNLDYSFMLHGNEGEE
jgi:hypothetical protein